MKLHSLILEAVTHSRLHSKTNVVYVADPHHATDTLERWVSDFTGETPTLAFHPNRLTLTGSDFSIDCLDPRRR